MGLNIYVSIVSFRK